MVLDVGAEFLRVVPEQCC